jgi:hypothetical protein
VTAKGSIKPGPEIEDENDFMVDLVINRTPGQKCGYESFISMRDQLTKGGDMQTEPHQVRINLEYDFKRQPIPETARMIEMSDKDASHLAFDTRPWPTAEDAVNARMVFDKWREDHCLKRLEDFASWQAFYTFHMGNRNWGKCVVNANDDGTESATGRVHLMRDTGYAGVALRTFLAA